MLERQKEVMLVLFNKRILERLCSIVLRYAASDQGRTSPAVRGAGNGFVEVIN